MNTEPYVLLPPLVRALRKCDRLAVTLNVARGYQRVSILNDGPEGTEDIDIDLPAPITVEGYYRGLPAGATAFALVYNYYRQHSHVSSVLRTLKAGDAIKFHFYPDALSTIALRDSGFHGDALYVHVYRNGSVYARFELAHVVSSVESVRMCRGFPDRGA